MSSFRRQETEELCPYHQELVEGYSTISTHLIWVKRMGWALIVLMTSCLGTLGGIAYSLTGLGHQLSLQALANRTNIEFHSKEISELKQGHRELYQKVEKLDYLIRGGRSTGGGE